VTYERVGDAYGRSVFIEAPSSGDNALPQGYSIAAVVLSQGWKAADLCWRLNALYGNLEDWDEFIKDAGARSFVFYGERADEASDICDALAFAWTAGNDASYEDVIASAHTEETTEQFVENVFSGEIMAGDRYADKLQNVIFSFLGDNADDAAVREAVERHHFD
jgi:hypothetical protein